jgi:hypothetical protein
MNLLPNFAHSGQHAVHIDVQPLAQKSERNWGGGILED